MKPEIVEIKKNAIVLGTKLEDIGDDIIEAQKAGLDTFSSIVLGVFVVAFGGVEEVAGKVDELTDSIK